MAHLPFVYLGNVAWSNDTQLHNCQALLIRHGHYRTKWCIMKQGAVAPVGQQLIILSAESALKNDCPSKVRNLSRTEYDRNDPFCIRQVITGTWYEINQASRQVLFSLLTCPALA